MSPVFASTRRRWQKGRRGTSAAEFALILPVLITLVLGAIDFGRFAYTYIAVTNAAREGAGFACFHPPPQSDPGPWIAQIEAAVVSELGSAFDPSKVTVGSPNVSNDGSGMKRVRVEVSYPFELIVNWPLLSTGSPITITRAVEMRIIR